MRLQRAGPRVDLAADAAPIDAALVRFQLAGWLRRCPGTIVTTRGLELTR